MFIIDFLSVHNCIRETFPHCVLFKYTNRNSHINTKFVDSNHFDNKFLEDRLDNLVLLISDESMCIDFYLNIPII